jgi:glycerol-3-phosphate acyltransferase PlsY
LFVVVVAATRYISLGSVVGAAALPFLAWLIERPPAPVVAAAAIGGAFIVWRHKDNIARLRAGKESTLSLGARP